MAINHRNRLRSGSDVYVGMIFFFIAMLFSMWIVCQEAKAQAAADSTIPVGKKYFLSVELAQLGAIVYASTEANTMLEARPFIGTGLNFSLMEFKQRYGLNAFALFYTEGEKVYPMAAMGFTLLSKRFAIGYDFGPVGEAFERTWQERLRLIVSFNPFQ